MARPAKRLSVSGEDKLELEKLLGSGVAPVRVVLRALALRQMGDGRSAPEAAEMVRLTGKAVRELGHRYRAGGWERALYDKQRPGKARLLDVRARQRIIAMVCGEPPAGQARWSVRLIGEEALKRKLVPPHTAPPHVFRLLSAQCLTNERVCSFYFQRVSQHDVC
jgi:putative transposase